MYNDDPLSENAFLTGAKWVIPMFIFLILALPMLQGTIGSQLNIMAMGLNGVARLATTPRVDSYANAPQNTVGVAPAPGSLEQLSVVPPAAK